MPSVTFIKKSFIIFILFIFFIYFPCISFSHSSSNDEIDDALANADLVAFFDNSSIVSLDGTISPNEYKSVFSDSSGNIDIFIEHNKTHLFYGVIANTNGWIAIGFNELEVTSAMANADFKLGSVVNDIPYAVDAHSCNPVDCGSNGFGQPENDTLDNIANFNGSENIKTTFEFVLPLNSLDSEDFNFGINDSLSTFAAYGPDDSFSSEHTDHTNVLTLFIAPELFVKDITVVIKLSLVDGDEINGSNNFEIMAIVTENETDLPIEGLLITFFKESTFGDLPLGSNATDSSGVARLVTNFTSYITEEVVLFAKSDANIEGINNYLQSESSLEVMYLGVNEEESPDFGDIYSPFQLSYLVPALTLGGVFLSLTVIWTSFLYVLKSIISFIFEKKSD